MVDGFFDNVIHGDKFCEFADVSINSPMPNKNIDQLDRENQIIFCKTDFIGELFGAIMQSNKSHILITHNSDYSIDKNKFESRPKCIKKWFALNVNYEDYNLIPIPSGMERPLGGGYSSDPNVLYKQLQKEKKYINLVYMCHNVNNNNGERQFVTEYLKKQPWVTYQEHGTSFEEYIKNCHSHKFVISPPGNGIDCHRTWEALYMGAIPIVKRSILTHGFGGLPLFDIIDWETVTEKMCNIVFDNVKITCMDKAKMPYWRNAILAYKTIYASNN